MSQAPAGKKKQWIGLGLGIILFIIIGYMFMPQTPEKYPAYDSKSPSPTGVKALYTYLSQHNKQVMRWQQPPEKLQRIPDGQGLIALGHLSAKQPKQTHYYRDFVKNGHTFIMVTQNPGQLFNIQTTKVSDHQKATPNNQSKETPDKQTHMIQTAGGQTYQAKVATPFRLKTKPSDQILLKDKQGVLALKRSIGKGQLIVALTPKWWTNGTLLEKDHLALVFYLLQASGGLTDGIQFNDYMHRPQNIMAKITVYPQWMIVIAMQFILLTLLWLWLKGKRFGPIRSVRSETVRYRYEYITALSAWKQKRSHYGHALDIQADYLKQLLQEHWRIAYHIPWSKLAEPLQRKWLSATDEDIKTLTQDLPTILAKTTITKQEYLQWSKRLYALQKEVENNETRTHTTVRHI